MSHNTFPHDAAYKAFFSNPEIFRNLLTNFVPKPLIADIDFDSLESFSTEHVTDKLSKRFNDVVWKLRWKDRDCYIYILLEFQSSPDYWMPVRILTYTSLLWENIIKKNGKKLGKKLPFVFPIVIYNGSREWSAPLSISQLLEGVPKYLEQYIPRHSYFLLDIARIGKQDLGEDKGNLSYIFRIEQASSYDEVESNYNKLLSLLNSEEYSLLRKSLETWIKCIFHTRTLTTDEDIHNPEKEQFMLAERVAMWRKELIQEGIEQGISQGIEQGISQGQKDTLFDLISFKFGSLPEHWKEIIQKINDSACLAALTRAILKIDSPEKFGELLTQSSTAK